MNNNTTKCFAYSASVVDELLPAPRALRFPKTVSGTSIAIPVSATTARAIPAHLCGEMPRHRGVALGNIDHLRHRPLVIPRQVRDFTMDPPNNSSSATLSIRRRFMALVTPPATLLIGLISGGADSSGDCGFAPSEPEPTSAESVCFSL